MLSVQIRLAVTHQSEGNLRVTGISLELLRSHQLPFFVTGVGAFPTITLPRFDLYLAMLNHCKLFVCKLVRASAHAYSNNGLVVFLYGTEGVYNSSMANAQQIDSTPKQ